jgi:hypothetical protein
MFGSGIYFAESAEIAYAKAWHKEIGCIIEAEVALGRCYEPQQAESFTYRKLKSMGYDSVWARTRPDGPMGTSQEWIVYSKYQVRLLSVKADGKELVYKRAKAGGELTQSERGQTVGARV